MKFTKNKSNRLIVHQLLLKNSNGEIFNSLLEIISKKQLLDIINNKRNFCEKYIYFFIDLYNSIEFKHYSTFIMKSINVIKRGDMLFISNPKYKLNRRIYADKKRKSI